MKLGTIEVGNPKHMVVARAHRIKLPRTSLSERNVQCKQCESRYTYIYMNYEQQASQSSLTTVLKLLRIFFKIIFLIVYGLGIFREVFLLDGAKIMYEGPTLPQLSTIFFAAVTMYVNKYSKQNYIKFNEFTKIIFLILHNCC